MSDRCVARTGLWSGLLSLVALGAAALAQQPVFHAGTDYVRVDVVVTDTDDKPLTNLTKDDFEIVEGGKRQAIDDFQFVSVPVEHRTINVGEPARRRPTSRRTRRPRPSRGSSS